MSDRLATIDDVRSLVPSISSRLAPGSPAPDPWSSSVIYAEGSYVSHLGEVWVSTRVSDLGLEPGTTPTLWGSVTQFTALVQNYLDIYGDSFDVGEWCGKASYAHVWLSMHFAVKHGHVEDVGSGLHIVSESFGQISTSFSSSPPNPKDGDFGSTSFGQSYLDLRRRVFVRDLVSPSTLGWD